VRPGPASALQPGTETRLLANRPMVMMQLVTQDVASSITIESVMPEKRKVNILPADAGSSSATTAQQSPHSSLSSVGPDLCTDNQDFTTVRTNDLFFSEDCAAGTCEQQEEHGLHSLEAQHADGRELPIQSQLVWQENPAAECCGQALGPTPSMPSHLIEHRALWTWHASCSIIRTCCAPD
jgi:hypothetical protein